jgi:hypothetical protein
MRSIEYPNRGSSLMLGCYNAARQWKGEGGATRTTRPAPPSSSQKCFSPRRHRDSAAPRPRGRTGAVHRRARRSVDVTGDRPATRTEEQGRHHHRLGPRQPGPRAHHAFSSVHVLVNNAGFGRDARIIKLSEADSCGPRRPGRPSCDLHGTGLDSPAIAPHPCIAFELKAVHRPAQGRSPTSP